MNRLNIKLTAGFATLVLIFTMGCTGLSHLRNDLAIQGMAKRSFARRECDRMLTPYSRDYERGWRQAYFDISRGLDGCPPSVPPETYWSTKYQTPEGCKHIVSWYDGYRLGAQAALAECRGSFSKIPVMANCTRPDAVDCTPIEPLRHVEEAWDSIDHQSVSTDQFSSPTDEDNLDRWTMPTMSVSSGVATQPSLEQAPFEQARLEIDQVSALPDTSTPPNEGGAPVAGEPQFVEQAPRQVLNPFATPLAINNTNSPSQFGESTPRQSPTIERVSAESEAETMFPLSSSQSQHLPAAR